jgi:hypothetical protein
MEKKLEVSIPRFVRAIKPCTTRISWPPAPLRLGDQSSGSCKVAKKWAEAVTESKN